MREPELACARPATGDCQHRVLNQCQRMLDGLALRGEARRRKLEQHEDPRIVGDPLEADAQRIAVGVHVIREISQRLAQRRGATHRHVERAEHFGRAVRSLGRRQSQTKVGTGELGAGAIEQIGHLTERNRALALIEMAALDPRSLQQSRGVAAQTRHQLVELSKRVDSYRRQFAVRGQRSLALQAGVIAHHGQFAFLCFHPPYPRSSGSLEDPGTR